MKPLLALLLSLCLLAGRQRTIPAETSPPSTPEQPASEQVPSQPVLRDEEYYLDTYGASLHRFFTIFSEEFESPSQLNQESVLFYTLGEICSPYVELQTQPEQVSFAYDKERDVYLIPAEMAAQKAEQFFGSIDCDFTDSTRYEPEQKAFAYTFAHGYPICYPAVTSVSVSESQIVFTVEYTNPEADGNPVLKILDFAFKETMEDGVSCLQAVSAVSQEISEDQSAVSPDSPVMIPVPQEQYNAYFPMLDPLCEITYIIAENFSADSPLSWDRYRWQTFLNEIEGYHIEPDFVVDGWGYYTEEHVEGNIMKYFPVTAEDIRRSNDAYSPELKAYKESAGMGGSTPRYEITDAVPNGNLLTLSYNLYEVDSNMAVPCVMVLEVQGDSWKYLSNECFSRLLDVNQ